MADPLMLPVRLHDGGIERFFKQNQRWLIVDATGDAIASIEGIGPIIEERAQALVDCINASGVGVPLKVEDAGDGWKRQTAIVDGVLGDVK